MDKIIDLTAQRKTTTLVPVKSDSINETSWATLKDCANRVT